MQTPVLSSRSGNSWCLWELHEFLRDSLWGDNLSHFSTNTVLAVLGQQHWQYQLLSIIHFFCIPRHVTLAKYTEFLVFCEKKNIPKKVETEWRGATPMFLLSVRPRGDFSLRLYKFWGSWTFLFKRDFWLGHFLLQDIKPNNHTCPVITEAGEGPYQSPVPGTGQRNTSTLNGIRQEETSLFCWGEPATWAGSSAGELGDLRSCQEQLLSFDCGGGIWHKNTMENERTLAVQLIFRITFKNRAYFYISEFWDAPLRCCCFHRWKTKMKCLLHKVVFLSNFHQAGSL